MQLQEPWSSQQHPEGFHKRCSILDFGPRLETQAGGAQKWIAWPAWAWRIVAPRQQRRAFDVFERAVTLLAQAGERTSIRQAELLGLDPQLTALIQTQLQARGVLDSNGALTTIGRKALECDQIDDTELVSGYVFQDPHGLELWPRFVESLAFAQVDYARSSGFATLIRGTTGAPRRYPVFTAVPVSPILPGRPDVVEIIEALRRNRRTRRLVSQQTLLEEDEGDENEGAAPLSEQCLSRVDFIDEQPTPVYLLSCLYFPKTEAISFGWRACDPFGTGDSLFLRQRVEAQLPDSPPLRELLTKIIGEEQVEVLQGMGDLLVQLEQAAVADIEARLTLDIRAYPSLLKRLISMERALAEAKSVAANGQHDKLDDVITRAQKAIEHLFHLVWQQFQRPECAPKLSLERNGWKHNAELFNDAAHRCGFPTPLPESLTRVKGGKVIPALERGRASLRPLVLGALLAASALSDHPLRRAATTAPKLLSQLDTLAGLRDQAAHDSEQRLSLKQVCLQRELTYTAVAILLNMPLVGPIRTSSPNHRERG